MGWVFEQVLGFNKEDPEHGVSHLQRFCQMLMKYFAGVRAVQVNAAIWLQDVTRARIYIIACQESVGGAKAAAGWALPHL